jgi:hypothetical protein
MDDVMKRYGMNQVLVLSALSLALAACSSGSNNLSKPNAETTPTKCSGNDCVPLEFTDDPVINLNYTCGTVQNVTDTRGVANCPNNSTVTFFLRADGGTRKVILGSVLVQPVRSVTAEESVGGSSPLLRITPRDLVSGVVGLNELDESTAAKTAVNITRLLQALRSRNAAGNQEEPYIDRAPVNRIKITNDLKANIELIEKDVLAADFGKDEIFTTLEPWLNADKVHPIVPVEASVAKERLTKTLKGLKAGLYYGSPALSVPQVNSDGSLVSGGVTGVDTSGLALGIEGSQTGDVNNRTTMAMYMLTDRSGSSVGQGLKWTGRATNSTEAYKLYTQTTFRKMRMANTGVGGSSIGGFDPLNNRVSQMTWTALKTASEGAQSIIFDQGLLIRDFVMAGNDPTYRRYTGISDAEAIPVKALGMWTQPEVQSSGNLSGAPEFKGTATITKSTSLNTFLDRVVWSTKDTVNTGESYVFPMHVTLKFDYNKTQVGCGGTASTNCPDLPDLPITILENGDIITDFTGENHTANCSSVDSNTLIDGAKTQEYRIGTVRAAYTGASADDLFISPIIVLSGDQFGALDGLQMGTLALAPRVKINVSPLKNNGTPVVPISDASTEASSAANSSPAQWVNAYNTYLVLKDANKRSAEESLKSLQYQGTVTADVSSCWVRQIK